MLLLALPMIIECLDSPVSCVIFKLLCFVVLSFCELMVLTSFVGFITVQLGGRGEELAAQLLP